MKFNIEIEIDDIYEGDCSLNALFKDELKDGMYKKVAEIIAKQDFSKIIKDETLNDIKIEYQQAINNLKENRASEIGKIEETITSAFRDFLDGIAYKVDYYGKPTEQMTVAEFIQQNITNRMKESGKELEKHIEKKVRDAMSVSDYRIEDIIKTEAQKYGIENAKKVTEFIMKGIK